MEKLRIDKYLWSIRIFKTRSLAADACDGGRVKWKGSTVKPSRQVSVGEHYEIKTPERNWHIQVTGLLHTRKAYAEAVNYYTDLTPEEEKTKEKRQTTSFYTGKRLSKVGRPTKSDRRDLDEFLDNV